MIITLNNKGARLDQVIWRGTAKVLPFTFDPPFSLEDKIVTANIFNPLKPTEKTPLTVEIVDFSNLNIFFSEELTLTFPFNKAAWEVFIKFSSTQIDSFIYGNITFEGANP